MKVHNLKVRNALSEKGKPLYFLEEVLSVSETTITRMMRRELPEEEQDRIVALIDEWRDCE